ncbi:hypothetical protein GCM10027610_102580 [Dactylosporangium cerinum]
MDAWAGDSNHAAPDPARAAPDPARAAPDPARLRPRRIHRSARLARSTGFNGPRSRSDSAFRPYPNPPN